MIRISHRVNAGFDERENFQVQKSCVIVRAKISRAS